MDDHSFEAISDDVHRLGVATLGHDDSGDVDAVLAVVKELPGPPDAWMLQRAEADGEVRLRLFVAADNTLHRVVGTYRIDGDASKPEDRAARSTCAYDAIPVAADATVEVHATRSSRPGREPLRVWNWSFHLGGGAEPIDLEADPTDDANSEIAELTLSFARALMSIIASTRRPAPRRRAGRRPSPTTPPAGTSCRRCRRVGAAGPARGRA